MCRSKVLIVATSRKTRGGITAVLKAYESGQQWEDFHCHWVQTHRDGPNWRKIAYLLMAWVDYLVHLPFCKIVHIHMSLQTTARRKVPFMKLAKLFGKGVIVHLHCGNQIDDIWNDNYTYLFTHADVSIFLSENLKSMVEAHVGTGHDFRVIYNPCPVVSEFPKMQKDKSILFSGTLYEGKGYRDLIRAFAAIADEFPEWKVVFAGNGEVETGRAMAEECGIQDRTEFLGWVSGDAKDICFRRASILCLPSYAEGFPMAVLDAWAYGIPVVTTPVGGIPDIARDGENILLFQPGDVKGLALKLKMLISSPDLQDKISAASKAFACGQFNLKTVQRQVYDLYAELLEK